MGCGDSGPKARDRPETAASYGIPTDGECTLPWSFVEETLAGERNYRVIVEGTATAERIDTLDDAYETKYDIRHGTPFFAVVPDRILAWSEFPADATRWRFDGT